VEYPFIFLFEMEIDHIFEALSFIFTVSKQGSKSDIIQIYVFVFLKKILHIIYKKYIFQIFIIAIYSIFSYFYSLRLQIIKYFY